MRVAVMVNGYRDVEAVLSPDNVERYMDDRPGRFYAVHVFELDAGLPGAGRVDPDNATTASGADDPVAPSPACFIADDIEC